MKKIVLSIPYADRRELLFACAASYMLGWPVYLAFGWVGRYAWLGLRFSDNTESWITFCTVFLGFLVWTASVAIFANARRI